MANLYERIYQLLEQLGVVELIERDVTYAKSKSEPFMDLVFEIAGSGEAGGFRYTDIYLAHYWTQNGDLMSDPLMMVRVWHYDEPMAEALSFRQDGGPWKVSYSYVTNANGQTTHVNPKAKSDNNNFLVLWLKNLLRQDHTLKGAEQIVL